MTCHPSVASGPSVLSRVGATWFLLPRAPCRPDGWVDQWVYSGSSVPNQPTMATQRRPGVWPPPPHAGVPGGAAVDSDRFDQLARALSARASRRRSVGGPLAGLLTALLLGADPLAAQREKKRGRDARGEGKQGKEACPPARSASRASAPRRSRMGLPVGGTCHGVPLAALPLAATGTAARTGAAAVVAPVLSLRPARAATVSASPTAPGIRVRRRRLRGPMSRWGRELRRNM